MSGQKIRTAGYPADGRVDRANGLNMWRTEGRVRPTSFDPRQLRFTGFIASGMSGGPVWRTFPEDSPCGRTHCVIGIVTECAINGNGQCKLGLGTDRLGVRITPQVKRLIKSISRFLDPAEQVQIEAGFKGLGGDIVVVGSGRSGEADGVGWLARGAARGCPTAP